MSRMQMIRSCASLVALGCCFVRVAAAQEDVIVAEDETTEYALIAATAAWTLDGRVGAYALGARLTGDVEANAFAVGLSYDLTEDAFIRVGYLGVFDETTPARPSPRDDRARAELYWTRQVGSVTLQHRSRVEHRFRDVADQTRYRPRLRATFGGGRVAPFVSAEAFYAFQDDDLQLVLLEGGAFVRLSERVSVSGSILYGTAQREGRTRIGLIALATRF